MKFPVYLGLLQRAESTLASAFRQVADGHGAEPDIHSTCLLLARQCDDHEQALRPAIERYGKAEEDADEPERLHASEMTETRSGPLGMLRDLQDLYVLASLVDVTWTMVKQVALGLRDEQLLQVVGECEKETATQLAWLKTRMSTAAPQALIAAR